LGIRDEPLGSGVPNRGQGGKWRGTVKGREIGSVLLRALKLPGGGREGEKESGKILGEMRPQTAVGGGTGEGGGLRIARRSGGNMGGGGGSERSKSCQANSVKLR